LSRQRFARMLCHPAKTPPIKGTSMARTPRTSGRSMATRSGKSAPAASAAPAAPGFPITFVVQGQRVLGAGAKRGGPGGATSGTLRCKEAVALTPAGSARSAADTNTEPQRLVAVPGEDVVVFHLQGGPSLVLHPETARDLMLAQGKQRIPTSRGKAKLGSSNPASDITEVSVPALLAWPGLQQATPTASRGAVTDWLGKVVLQTVEVLTGFAKDEAVSFVASQVVKKLDGQVNAGVYALQPLQLPAFKQAGQQPINVPSPTTTGAAANAPILVMIHGTFVDTSSTFGKLWQHHPKTVADLFAAYGNRVYALDHATVGVSPVANAITLVQALPADACLHLATHSRGGLVAEVLARVAHNMAHQPQLTAADLAFFAGDGYQSQQAELVQLAQLVRSKRIQVQRVLRVACPARGTLLASKRLDAYLSVLQWTLQLAGVPVLPQLVDFLNEVARRRADPSQLPGIAAMIADTPLVNWLNSAPTPIAGDLRVVAGDLQGDSLGGWLKTLLADAYYWTDNDVVVQTRSMYGGSPRVGGALFLLDRGGECTHFNYFANAKTVQALLDGLTQPQPSGFAPIGPLSWAGQSSDGTRSARAAKRSVSAADAARPAVIVLPGILGSHLQAGGDRIWLSWRLVGGLHKLQYTGKPDGVLPDGPIGLVYDDISAHLAKTHAVTEFAFDWRRPIEQEAERLADLLDTLLAARSQSQQPVRLLAHSMGGLVARTVQLVRPKTFSAWLANDGARLLMLGTPNGGSWAPMQVLSGDDTMGNALASFGSPLRNHEARQWMAQMPGFLQLQAGLTDPALNLADHNTWAQLAAADLQRVQQANWWHHSAGEAPDAAYSWGLPSQAVLDQAVALRRRLDQQLQNDLPSFAAKLLLVVGQAPFTPNGFEVGDGGFVYVDSPQGGDGRVPLHQALLPGVKTWQLACEHGTMPDAQTAFEAFTELLTSGTTTQLMALVAGSRSAARSADLSATDGMAQLARSRPSRGLLGGQLVGWLGRWLGGLPAGDARSVLGAGQAAAGAAAGSTPFRAGRLGQAAPLQVTVLNGNLAFVNQPLLVGHTRASVLTGSEYVVDRLIGGGMATSLATGLYPDAPGSHQVFVNTHRNPDNPWRDPQPGKVLVLGLGAEGKLTEQDLTHTVRLGVLALLQRESNAAAYGQPVASEIGLAATLMGSGGAGMNPSTAARAIATGVAQANAAVAYTQTTLKEGQGRPPGWSPAWPQVAHLTLVELYLERASDAWAGLQVLADSAPGRYAITPTISSGVGPLRRQIETGYRGTDHDFISATGDGADRIAFTLDTKRARTEITAQSTQGQLLRNLVGLASNGELAPASAGGGHLGRTLFQLLVPPTLEPFLSGTNRLVLELDAQTAPIPWELLDTPSSDQAPGLGSEPAQGRQLNNNEPWAIRTQLLRKLRTDTYRQAVQDASLEDAVLVIGEPQADPRLYGPLPAALHEAQAVNAALTRVLSADKVTLLTGANAATVINTLFARNYRIVHIAGHGEPPSQLTEATRSASAEQSAPKTTQNKGGVVLSEGSFLGPDEIRSMRCVPELVFVNCCHLAKRDTAAVLAQPATHFNRPAFAYGVADELINMGVRCVVAAGWAVDDVPAQEFAQAFYGALLKGSKFIEAVTAGRKAARGINTGSDSDSSTWAAYQCYGDPDWVFNPGSSAATAKPVAHPDEYAGVSSPLGLALALEEVAVRARYMNGNAAEQQTRVAYLEKTFAAKWGGMGAIAEAFAVGHQSTGNAQRALYWYQQALLCEDASASMKVQEQRGNLMAREAWSQAQAADPSDPAALASARDSITQALRNLQLLASLHPTQERHSLCGSAYKRLGLLHTRAGDKSRARGAFTEAAQHYQKAETLAQKTDPAGLFYPAMNRMALELELHRGQSSWQGFDAAQTARVSDSLKAKLKSDPDFWAHAGVIELDLMQALATGRLRQQVVGLTQEFEALHRRVAAPYAWASVADQAGLLLASDPSKEAQQLLVQLRGYAK
jgi:tetratricopeptide (TPR) repeat protein